MIRGIGEFYCMYTPPQKRSHNAITFYWINHFGELDFLKLLTISLHFSMNFNISASSRMRLSACAYGASAFGDLESSRISYTFMAEILKIFCFWTKIIINCVKDEKDSRFSDFLNFGCTLRYLFFKCGYRFNMENSKLWVTWEKKKKNSFSVFKIFSNSNPFLWKIPEVPENNAFDKIYLKECYKFYPSFLSIFFFVVNCWTRHFHGQTYSSS